MWNSFPQGELYSLDFGCMCYVVCDKLYAVKDHIKRFESSLSVDGAMCCLFVVKC